MIELLAQQNLTIGYVITGLGVGLGLLAVCIPRPRSKFATAAERQVKKKSVRHSTAGSLQQRSKYGQHKKR